MSWDGLRLEEEAALSGGRVRSGRRHPSQLAIARAQAHALLTTTLLPPFGHAHIVAWRFVTCGDVATQTTIHIA
jgi:hypothetical protein